MADGIRRMVDSGQRRSISHPRFAISHQPLAILGLAFAVAACHPTVPPPARLPPSPSGYGGTGKPDTTSDRLKNDIDALLAAPALAHGYWGVLVKSLKTDETLYAVNAKRLMMPASNMKTVTLAAA